MVHVSELDSFIRKFKELWKSGVGAHLDIDTHAGEAWVGLRVRLGHVPGPPHHVKLPRKTRDSPSRQRRRARRAAARQRDAEEAIDDVGDSPEAEEATTDEEVVNGATENDGKAAETAGSDENSKIESSGTENVELAAKVDDEFCSDELYYPVSDGKTALTCFQCDIKYFPDNYVEGDEIVRHILCRRHLGVSKCEKCGKSMIGLGTIRVHRQTCQAPS